MKELIGRYLRMNGVLSIDKLVELLNDEHDLEVTKEEVVEDLRIHGTDIINNKYVSFIKDFPLEEMYGLLKSKEKFSKYRIVNIDEVDYEDEFLDELDAYMKNLPSYDKELIQSYLISLIFNGIYDKDFLKMVLDNNNLSKYTNDLDKIASKYKNKVGIWKLNGFTISERMATGKKIGRNDPCPCGSGKKYKQCCGK